MPQLLLVDRCRVLGNRYAALAAVASPEFKPSEEVILESTPQPWPEPSTNNRTVKLLDSSSDHLTIQADLAAPAVLLVTDSYSRYWKARPLQPGSQKHYAVLPANYCLRAIPLAAGLHHIRLEYAPPAFAVGKWISLASLTAFTVLTGLWLRTRRR